MQFAHNDHRLKIPPLYSGQRAVCPYCSATLIGKCGQIYVRHWQHEPGSNCDPWKEHETDWHRNWKAQFPVECQEVIIDREGERHIADVLTPNGKVVEFQNSAISSSTIEIREEFYEEMVWVINAEKFKDHFKLKSEVKANLRKIDSGILSRVQDLKRDQEEQVSYWKGKITQKETSLSSYNRSLEKKKNELDQLLSNIHRGEEFVESFLADCEASYNVPYIYTHSFLREIGYRYQESFLKISEKMKENGNQLSISRGALQEILDLKEMTVDNKLFKLVSFKQIPPESFARARAVDKETMISFFPLIHKFSSRTEFLSFEYKQDRYAFAVDPVNAIQHYQEKILQLEGEAKKWKEELEEVRHQAQKRISEESAAQLDTLVGELTLIESKRNATEEQLESFKQDLIRLQEQFNLELYELEQNEKNNHSSKRYQIMKAFKGQYTFEWKYERKSWQYANCPIYFDTGEDYLLERCGESKFRKISKQEFVDRICD